MGSRSIGVAALAIAMFATLFGASGCGMSFSVAPENGEIMSRLREKYKNRPRTFDPIRPLPFSIAVAPISYAQLDKQAAAYGRETVVVSEETPNGASPLEGADAEGAEGSGGADSEATPATEDGETGYYRTPFESEGELAIRYRKPLYRQLLFAPIDPDLIGSAPAVAKLPRAAQGEPGVAYVCARCLNDVGAADDRCRHCGLTFAPEPAPWSEPRPVPTADPTTPDVPPTTDPGTAPPSTEPTGPVIAGGPMPAERFICYLCHTEQDPTEPVCPTCRVPFTTELRAPRPGDPLLGYKEGQFYFPPEDRTYAVYAPDADELQDVLADAIRQYGAVNAVEVQRERELVEDLETLLDLAWNEGHTLLMRPVLKRCDVAYKGYSGLRWFGSFALWVAAWVPSWFVPVEEYEVTIEMDIELRHARTGKEIPRWRKRYVGTHRTYVYPFDRGWYLGYDLIGVPFFHMITEDGRRNMMENMYANALADLKEELLDQTYNTFVKDPVILPEVQDSRNVALLIGADAVPEAQSTLEFTQLDIESLEETLVEVSRFVTVEGAKTRSQGEVVRFDSAQPKDAAVLIDRDRRFPTLANVRRWLDSELPKLERVDNFVMYFSGFGAARKVDEENTLWGDGHEKYLCFSDTNPADLEGTALSMRELKRYLDGANCRNVLLILDTSFAAQPGEGEVEGASGKTLRGVNIEDRITGQFLEDLGKRGAGKRAVVIAASSVGDPAYESEGLGEGGEGMSVLTDAIVKGIQGEAATSSGRTDGVVRVQELTTYVQETCRNTGAFVLGVPVEVQIEGRAARLGIVLKPKAIGQ